MPGTTVDMAFKVFVSPVLELVTEPNCRALYCDFRVRCSLGGASCGTMVMFSTEESTTGAFTRPGLCPDDLTNPNVRSYSESMRSKKIQSKVRRDVAFARASEAALFVSKRIHLDYKASYYKTLHQLYASNYVSKSL